MRICAIQNYGVYDCARKSQPKTYVEQPNEVSFKSAKLKGAGLGALLGMGALALISGGAAAPVAYAVYAAIHGSIGAGVGDFIDKNKDNP
jgi:hypothetical protein